MPQDLRKADLIIGRMHIFGSKFSYISFLLLWKNSKPFKWGCSWCHALLMIRWKKTPMYMVKREMQYHQELEIQMNYCLYILFAYLVLLNALFNCHLVNRLLSNYRLLKICKWNTNVDRYFFLIFYESSSEVLHWPLHAGQCQICTVWARDSCTWKEPVNMNII